MRAIVCQVSGQYYAVDTQQVLEVIPMVQTEPLAHAPAAVRGLINYRGQLIPLVETATLLGQALPEPRRAWRILVAGPRDAATSENRPLGLLVERLVGIEDLPFPGDSGLSSSAETDAGYLGAVTLTDQRAIRLIDPSRIPQAVEKAS